MADGCTHPNVNLGTPPAGETRSALCSDCGVNVSITIVAEQPNTGRPKRW